MIRQPFASLKIRQHLGSMVWRRSHCRFIPAVPLLLLSVVALPVAVQSASAPQPTEVGMQAPSNVDPFGDNDADPNRMLWREKQLRALNAERQKSMVSDTGKLLKLVHQLDSEISSANPGSLNADQLHMLAEIERLARSVKEKMSTSVRGTNPYPQPSLILEH
jgi:hypothetical protein